MEVLMICGYYVDKKIGLEIVEKITYNVLVRR